MQDLGKRLRELRHGQRLTLAELGGLVGLSASYLSQIERGVTMPSLPKLTAIARALGVELGHFFEDDTSALRIVRSDQGRRIEDTADAVLELLSAAPSDKKIQPSRVVCDTGVSRDWPATYVGEVFGFVLEGQLTVSVGNETYVLSPGDSIHYQALQPHCWRNDGDEPCTALWAASPPVLEADLREEEPEGRR